MGEPGRIAEMLAALDDDHARLRELGGSILRAIDADDVDMATRALLQLQGAQTAHFRFEESLMEEAGFPGRATHAESHNRLVAALNTINNALGDGHVSGLSRDLGDFIGESLNHIAELDEAFHGFLTEMLG
jgi:hemerythrin-like metal-binding protein